MAKFSTNIKLLSLDIFNKAYNKLFENKAANYVKCNEPTIVVKIFHHFHISNFLFCSMCFNPIRRECLMVATIDLQFVQSMCAWIIFTFIFALNPIQLIVLNILILLHEFLIYSMMSNIIPLN